MLGSLSASAFVCFAVIAQNTYLTTHKLFYVKHPLACFGNSFISHTQMTCQLGPGGFT